MNTVVAVVFVERLQNRHVGCIFDNMIDPFDALDHLVAKNIEIVISSIRNQNLDTPTASFSSDKLIGRRFESEKARELETD
jgi:hypothetical protein